MEHSSVGIRSLLMLFGAGVGELVLTAAGSSARQTDVTKNKPVDAVIMAIVDSIEVHGEIQFQK